MLSLVDRAGPETERIEAIHAALSSTSLCINLSRLIAEYSLTCFEQRVTARCTRIPGVCISQNREQFFYRTPISEDRIFAICNFKTMKMQRHTLPHQMSWGKVGSLTIQGEHLLIVSKELTTLFHYTMTSEGHTLVKEFPLAEPIRLNNFDATIYIDHSGTYAYMTSPNRNFRYDLNARAAIAWTCPAMTNSYHTLKDGRILFARDMSNDAHFYNPNNQQGSHENLSLRSVTDTCTTSHFYVFCTRDPMLHLYSLDTGCAISSINLTDLPVYSDTLRIMASGNQLVHYYYGMRDSTEENEYSIDVHDLSRIRSPHYFGKNFKRSASFALKAEPRSSFFIFYDDTVHFAISHTVSATKHFSYRFVSPTVATPLSSSSSSSSKKRELASASPQDGNKKQKT